jgi:putative ABC transport system ATP-binding protein
MSLKLKDVKKSFREPGGGVLPVLRIVDFELKPAEQMALVGESGGGKTTLLNVIAGITQPDSGSVQIDNVEITRLSEPARDRFRAERIGIVFQTFNLLPAFSALENVLLGMSFSGKADQAFAKKLLEQVGLSHRLSHRPPQLSVGEQQRVAVARALANKPKLMLADEPTASVDTAHQQNILSLLRSACEEFKVSLLLVTHSPEVAAQFPRLERLKEFNQPEAAI